MLTPAGLLVTGAAVSDVILVLGARLESCLIEIIKELAGCLSLCLHTEVVLNFNTPNTGYTVYTVGLLGSVNKTGKSLQGLRDTFMPPRICGIVAAF